MMKVVETIGNMNGAWTEFFPKNFKKYSTE
jgi:hypothetical protein